MGFGATWSDSDTGQSAASGFRAITEHARTIAGTANRRLYGLAARASGDRHGLAARASGTG